MSANYLLDDEFARAGLAPGQIKVDETTRPDPLVVENARRVIKARSHIPAHQRTKPQENK